MKIKLVTILTLSVFGVIDQMTIVIPMNSISSLISEQNQDTHNVDSAQILAGQLPMSGGRG